MTSAVPISFSQPCRGEPSRCNSSLCIRPQRVEGPYPCHCAECLRCSHPGIQVKTLSSTQRAERTVTGHKVREQTLQSHIHYLSEDKRKSRKRQPSLTTRLCQSGGSDAAVLRPQNFSTTAPAAASGSLEAQHASFRSPQAALSRQLRAANASGRN